MPYQGYADGLCLLMQPGAKGVDHYGILDIGNRIGHPQVDGRHPIVIHQTPPTIVMNWLQETGSWSVRGRITDEPYAIGRLKAALKNPSYDVFGNNCEHFARFVATGKRESTQLQVIVVVAGLAALAFAAWHSEG